MAAVSRPRPHDLIIRREPIGTFTLGDSSGTPQILCRTFDELLQRAVRFAATRRARFWYSVDGQTCAPLIDVALLRRMWGEFAEMPGLCLTRPQVRRLWGVDAETCASALDALVALNALARLADGSYSFPSIVREPSTLGLPPLGPPSHLRRAV